jgi:hypothetical protein
MFGEICLYPPGLSHDVTIDLLQRSLEDLKRLVHGGLHLGAEFRFEGVGLADQIQDLGILRSEELNFLTELLEMGPSGCHLAHFVHGLGADEQEFTQLQAEFLGPGIPRQGFTQATAQARIVPVVEEMVSQGAKPLRQDTT